MKYLLQMLTSQPPLSHAGTRFVTLAVCIIISSGNLLWYVDIGRMVFTQVLWIVASIHHP